VAPGETREAAVTLHAGPFGGEIRLEVDGASRLIAMRPDETTTETFPMPPGTRLVRLAAQSSHAFRPADVDPSSSDTRRLGVQVRLELRP
jgi:hypothetical protein